VNDASRAPKSEGSAQKLTRIGEVGPRAFADFAAAVERLAPEHRDRPEVTAAIHQIVASIDAAVNQGEEAANMLADPKQYITQFEQPNWTNKTAYNIARVIIPAVQLVQPIPDTPGLRQAMTPKEVRRSIARSMLRGLDDLDAEIGWEYSRFARIRVTPVEGSRRRGFAGISQKLLRAGRIDPFAGIRPNGAGAIISLQGVPGSGKSVELRSYARQILSQAVRGGARAKLAVYVSLREFDVPPDLVDADVLRAYISRVTNPGHSRILTEYFARQFEADIDAGRVTLLLDSFDEIPAIAGMTTDSVSAVILYQRAIHALVGGSNTKCIVASREYRGPRTQVWPRLLLVGLSFQEQVTILRNQGVDEYLISLVETLLRDPRRGFSSDLRAPLTLKLLGVYLLEVRRAPARPTQIFEHYVGALVSSLGLDVDTIDLVLSTLCFLAFELTRVPEASFDEVLDLVAARSDARYSREQVQYQLELARAAKILMRVQTRDEMRFAFTHRRLQEYFATRFVLAHPSEISLEVLVKDGNWRETTVALLQESPDEAHDLIEVVSETLSVDEEAIANAVSGEDVWTEQSFHLFEMLVAAYYANTDRIPSPLREHLSRRLDLAWKSGTISDRKFALDCLPLAASSAQVTYATESFSGQSLWLRSVAFRECARLHRISNDLLTSMARLLVTFVAHRRASPGAGALDSDLKQLHDDARIPLMWLRRWLTWIPVVAVAICIFRVGAYYAVSPIDITDPYSYRWEVLYWVVAPLSILWLYLASEPLSFGINKSRLRLTLERIMRLMNMQLPTDSPAIYDTVLLFAIFAMLAWIVSGMVALAMTDWSRGFVDLFVLSIASLYALTWASSAVTISTEAVATGGKAPILLLIMAPLQIAGYKVRTGYIGVLKYIGGMLLGLILILAPILALIWVIFTYGGRIGRDSLTILSIIFASIIPLVLIAALYRYWRSRRRVRRLLARLGTPSTIPFLRALLELGDIAERCDFVRQTRIDQSSRSVTIARGPVRELAQLMNRSSTRGFDAVDLNQYSSEIGELLVSGVLSPQSVSVVDNDLLDELARLEEVLRLNRISH
jgi:hypothetical protein